MSWLRMDDGFDTDDKITALSDAEFRLHTSAMLHCAKKLTDGVLLSHVPETFPKTPKKQALKKAISRLVSLGLWEKTELGWIVHSYLKWNPTREQVLAKRAARSAAGARGGVARAQAIAKQTPSNCQSVATTIRVAKPCPVPVPVPDQVDPRPTATTYPLTPEGGQQPQPNGSAGTTPARVPCPGDLTLTGDQRASLEASLVPGWAIDQITADFRAAAVGDPDDRRPLVAWRKCLARAISGRWGNPAQRPRREEQPADDLESEEDLAGARAEQDRIEAARAERQRQRDAKIEADIASGALVIPPMPGSPQARMELLTLGGPRRAQVAPGRGDGTVVVTGRRDPPKAGPAPSSREHGAFSAVGGGSR